MKKIALLADGWRRYVIYSWVEGIMEVPEHSEVTKMQPVDNGQEENMHIVEDMVG